VCSTSLRFFPHYLCWYICNLDVCMTNVLLDLYCVHIQPIKETWVKHIKEIATNSRKWTSRRSLIDLLLKSKRNCCLKDPIVICSANKYSTYYQTFWPKRNCCTIFSLDYEVLCKWYLWITWIRMSKIYVLLLLRQVKLIDDLT
jgi:hypothetical protein